MFNNAVCEKDLKSHGTDPLSYSEGPNIITASIVESVDQLNKVVTCLVNKLIKSFLINKRKLTFQNYIPGFTTLFTVEKINMAEKGREYILFVYYRLINYCTTFEHIQ